MNKGKVSNKIIAVISTLIACLVALLVLQSCALKEIDYNDINSIEDAVGKAQNMPIDFNKKYSVATPTEKGQSENMIITVAGLKGGSAEVYLDEGKIFASEFLVNCLNKIGDNTIHFRIAGIKCGEKNTALPSGFTLTLNINKKHEAEIKKLINEVADDMKNNHPNDNAFTTTITVEQASGTFPSQQDTEKIVGILNALPNGIMKMNGSYKDIIETIGNIGFIDLTDGKLNVSALLRSTNKDTLKKSANEITDSLKSFKIDWEAPEIG